MSFRSTPLVRITELYFLCSYSRLIRMPRVQILQERKDQSVRQRYGMSPLNKLYHFAYSSYLFSTGNTRTRSHAQQDDTVQVQGQRYLSFCASLFRGLFAISVL